MATAVSLPAHSLVRRSPVVWWHLLSLDAPSVAVLWTAFLAREFGAPQPLTVPVALGLAVWLLYAADRIHDAARGELAEERHRFHAHHRTVFLVTGSAIASLLAVLLFLLPSAVRTGWCLLALPLLCYFFAVHVLQVRRWPKEPLVAMFFAVATTIPLFMTGRVTRLTEACIACAFGGLCWLNCIAIARWEHTLAASDICTAWLGARFSFAAAATMTVASALLLLPSVRPVALACVTAAACLLLLDSLRCTLHRTTLRALADAALLSPLAVWPLLAHLRSR